jgi:hypothetical protein
MISAFLDPAASVRPSNVAWFPVRHEGERLLTEQEGFVSGRSRNKSGFADLRRDDREQERGREVFKEKRRPKATP